MRNVRTSPGHRVPLTSYQLPNTIYCLPSTKIPISNLNGFQGAARVKVNDYGFGAALTRRLERQTSILPRPRRATDGVQTHRSVSDSAAAHVGHRLGSELSRLERSIERDRGTLSTSKDGPVKKNPGFVAEK